jgi:hypothetical protein
MRVMKAHGSHKTVLSVWKNRRKAFRKEAGGSEGKTSLGHADKAEQSIARSLPCVAAEYSSSVLGVVSDRFADSLQAFIDSQKDMAKTEIKAFRDAMHLRCAVIRKSYV